MSFIAEGSFGQVFTNGNKVVKKTKLVDENEDEQIVYSTIREIAFLKKFKHPNIINLIDAKIVSDECHIFLEHGGITLSKWMKETKNREKYILFISYQILDALSFLEKHNITHCDLKPCNILIDKNHHIRLIDFGGVSFLPSSDSISLCSTVTYKAPEQRDSSLQIGSFNDIFSFGLTMCSVLFGKHPPDKIDFSNEYVDILKIYKKKFSDICNPSGEDLIEDLNILKFFTSCLQVDYIKRPTASKLLSDPLFKKYRKQYPIERIRVYNDLSFMDKTHNSNVICIVNNTIKDFKRLFELRRLWKHNNRKNHSLYSHIIMNKLVSNNNVFQLLETSEDYKYFLAHFCIDLSIILFDDKKKSNLLEFDEVDSYFEIRKEMHCKILPIIDFDVYIDIL